MRTLNRLAMIVTVLVFSAIAVAQGQIIADKNYESDKAAELESIKLQLSTRSGSAAFAELTAADSSLRRLRAAKGKEERAKLAADLESALVRLHLEADSVAPAR